MQENTQNSSNTAETKKQNDFLSENEIRNEELRIAKEDHLIKKKLLRNPIFLLVLSATLTFMASIGVNFLKTYQNNCQSKVVADACRAYDKSGFHSHPHGSCTINLVAGEGMYFRQGKVDVISESYRRNANEKTVRDRMKPEADSDGNIIEFKGSIACTNSRGTGRTCEATASVKATAYPIACK